MQHTSNYNLNLPEGTDHYSVSDFNQNFTTIDQQMKANSVAVKGFDYSTSEKVVGTWINGKPVYQRTDTMQNLSSGFSTILDGTSAAVDELVFSYVVLLTPDGINTVVPYYYADTSVSPVYYRVLKGTTSTWNNGVMLHASTAVTELTAILQYTKTTDEATT